MKRAPSTKVREPTDGVNPRAMIKGDETFGAWIIPNAMREWAIKKWVINIFFITSTWKVKDNLNNTVGSKLILSRESFMNSNPQDKWKSRDNIFMPNKFPPLNFVLKRINRVPSTTNWEDTLWSILPTHKVTLIIIQEKISGRTSNSLNLLGGLRRRPNPLLTNNNKTHPRIPPQARIHNNHVPKKTPLRAQRVPIIKPEWNKTPISYHGSRWISEHLDKVQEISRARNLPNTPTTQEIKDDHI